MNVKIPTDVDMIIRHLQHGGYTAYIVGGCIRDSILNKKPNDWDICTSAIPNEVVSIFKRYKIIETGLQHGTVTVFINNIPYEITTYRIENEYLDNRRPDSVNFTNQLLEDLKRRDFTINAIAYNNKDGLVDPYNGLVDIENKIIKCVGNPKERFEEDALRILRALRFAAQLEFTIEEKTSEAIKNSKHLLQNISKERINSELCKILMSKNGGSDILREYADVIEEFIPEIKPMIGFDQNNPHHIYDVWEHTLHCLQEVEICETCIVEIDIIIRLAVLFHDIGKPNCYTEDKNGIGHFYKHTIISSDITEKILKRLRFSNNIIEDVVELVRYHDMEMAATKPFIKRTLNKMGEKQFYRLIELKMLDKCGQRRDENFLDKLLYLLSIKSLIGKVKEEESCFQLKNLDINGKDIMNLGVPEGKIIGVVLEYLLNLVINEEVENKKEDLLEKVKEFLERRGDK